MPLFRGPGIKVKPGLGPLQFHKVADKRGPVLDQEGHVVRRNGHEEPPDFDKGERWPLLHVEVLGPLPEKTTISTKYISRELPGGWIVFQPTSIVFVLADGKAHYRIVREPGRHENDDGTHEVLHHWELELDRVE